MTPDMMQVMPTLNINGTSVHQLMAQTIMCIATLRVAVERLEIAMPHPDDYPIGNYERAREQHRMRIRYVEAILHDMEAIGESISEQEAQKK